jgi:hypothetical protein
MSSSCLVLARNATDVFDEDTAGRRVVLIDTPVFDDTLFSDVDFLNMIAAFLGNL